MHSSSHMTDDDLKAIAVYLLSLKPAVQTEPAASCGLGRAHDGRSGDLQGQLRRLPYRRWNWITQAFSAPSRSPAVQSDDPTTLIHTVLFGSQGAGTTGAPTGPAMPSFAWRLSDAQVAAVVTYIRNTWGNAAATVSADKIQTIRGKREEP